jgi:hypothetical protein
MATWNDLAGYVRTHYKIAAEEPGMIRLIFEVADLRSQIVMLWSVTPTNSDEEWVQIESPIGEFSSVDVVRAVKEAGTIICGGIASVDSLVTFRHSVPLLNLNINEFERPLAVVTTTADRLENLLTGRDEF